MKFLTIAGTAAMFLVGGGILAHAIGPLHHAIVELLPADGIVDMDNLETAWEGIAGFLRQHLEGRAAKPAPVAAPTASAAAAAAAH